MMTESVEGGGGEGVAWLVATMAEEKLGVTTECRSCVAREVVGSMDLVEGGGVVELLRVWRSAVVGATTCEDGDGVVGGGDGGGDAGGGHLVAEERVNVCVCLSFPARGILYIVKEQEVAKDTRLVLDKRVDVVAGTPVHRTEMSPDREVRWFSRWNGW